MVVGAVGAVASVQQIQHLGVVGTEVGAVDVGVEGRGTGGYAGAEGGTGRSTGAAGAEGGAEGNGAVWESCRVATVAGPCLEQSIDID